MAPLTQTLVKYVLGISYGGNFAVRRTALDALLHAIGRVELVNECYLFTSARRYVAMGT